MRILQVLPNLSKGGAERVVIELSNALINSNHEITLLAAHPVDIKLNQQSLNEKAHVSFIAKKPHNRIFEYIRLPFWIAVNWKKLKRYDVIHCHLTYGLIFGLFISFFRKITLTKNLRLIATCHVVGVGISLQPRIINEKLSRFFDVFVLIAEDDLWRKFIRKNRKQNIEIVRNGISPKVWFHSSKDTGNEITFTVGTISRLQSERKPWLFLEVFAHIHKLTEGKVHFVLGGDGPEKELLLTLAEKLGIRQNLSMPGLVIHPSQILANLDLYIALNVEETTGIAGLEAVFSSVPVVSIQLSSTYSSGDKDWIFSNQDPQVVAMKIVALLTNSDEIIRTEKDQYHMAIKNYSIERMRDAYLKLYQRK